jgi:prevent-host-death family protein
VNKKDPARTVASSQLRQNSGELMDAVLTGQTVVVTRHGRPAMLLLPVKEYEALMNARATLADMIRRQVGQ